MELLIWIGLALLNVGLIYKYVSARKEVIMRRERCVELERRIVELSKMLRAEGYSNLEIKGLYIPEAAAKFEAQMRAHPERRKERPKAF